MAAETEDINTQKIRAGNVFKDHVGKYSVKSIVRTAKERRLGVLGYSEAMMVAYNAKNKYRLSLRALYAMKVSSVMDEEEGSGSCFQDKGSKHVVQEFCRLLKNNR